MIYIVINSKGGVGKSTLANQILPAYLYQKTNQPINLIEIDDENEDSAILSKSDILNAKTIHTSKIKTIDEVFIDDEDIIIDVGGNKTATIFLDEIKKVGEFDNVVWFIPIGKGIQDAANANDTANSIKDIDKNATIIYVLSNSQSHDDLEWEYLHFFGNEFLETPFAIDTNNYIVIPHSDILNNSKTFGKTVFDIAQNDTNFKEKSKEAKRAGDDFKKKKYLFLNRVRNEAVEYINKLNDHAFKELDKIIG